MESPPPLPGRTPVFFALLIALLSLGAIWFTAAFLLPKAQHILTHSPRFAPVPLGGATVIGAYGHILAATGGGLLIAALLAGAALLPKLSAKIRRRSAWALQGLALLLFGSTLYIALVTVLGVIWGHMSESAKVGVYRRELETFAIAEAAQGRFERTVEAVQRESSLRPRVVQSEADLTPNQRRRQLTNYEAVLDKTSDLRTRRRILATLPFFKKTIDPGLRGDHPFLRHARELSGQDFVDMRALLAWLPTAPKEDGWETLPVFVIE